MEPIKKLRLGVNIDHVATVRNARGSSYPDPVRAAIIAQEAGADGVTAHLREDRRHIVDQDIASIIKAINIPLNFEMAATDEMQKIALAHGPHAVCIVPEKREERTTEGGLDVVREEKKLAHFITPLRDKGSRVSIFIAADENQIRAASRIGAQVVELHTGAYCDLHYEKSFRERDAEKALAWAYIYIRNGGDDSKSKILTAAINQLKYIVSEEVDQQKVTDKHK